MRRREFLEKMAMSAVAVPCAALADESYEGTVTGSGKPLRDVVVTDGLNCAVTDRNGRFRIAKRPSARFISITVPSGWRTVGAHYRPVAADSFAFDLKPWRPSADNGCGFVQVADSETDAFAWLKALNAAADRADAAFIIHTGDICRKGGMEAHAKNLL